MSLNERLKSKEAWVLEVGDIKLPFEKVHCMFCIKGSQGGTYILSESGQSSSRLQFLVAAKSHVSKEEHHDMRCHESCKL